MKKLIRPSPEEELEIYRKFLIDLHTCHWTGNKEGLHKRMDRLAAYSYSRTNSNGDWEQEERQMIETLLNLNK